MKHLRKIVIVIAESYHQYEYYMKNGVNDLSVKYLYLYSENILRGLKDIEVIRTGEWWFNRYCESPLLAELEGRNNGVIFNKGEHVNIRGKSEGKSLIRYVEKDKPLENVVINSFDQYNKCIVINGDFFLPIDLEKIKDNNFSNEIRSMFDDIINDL